MSMSRRFIRAIICSDIEPGNYDINLAAPELRRLHASLVIIDGRGGGDVSSRRANVPDVYYPTPALRQQSAADCSFH